MNEGRELTRGLGLVPAIAINVGNMIGTGIFLKTRVMTCNVGASSTVLAVWLIENDAGVVRVARLLYLIGEAADGNAARP